VKLYYIQDVIISFKWIEHEWRRFVEAIRRVELCATPHFRL